MIEVLASWMLEHPLPDEQQRREGLLDTNLIDTPSSDGPETVQCPESPATLGEPNER